MDRRFERVINTENFLEGAPQEIWERPEGYEGSLPLIKRTVNLVKQYGKTKPNKRGAVFEQYVQPYAKNPKAWGQIADNLDLIASLRPEVDIIEIKTQLFAQIETNAAHRSNLAGWIPEKIEELTRFGLDTSGELGGLIERVKAAIFNAPRTPQEALAIQYNAAWAMISTADNRIREELFSMLCYEKPWFTAGSLGNFFFTVGSIFPDDATCEKYYAVHEVLGPVGLILETKGKLVPTSSVRMNQRYQRLIEAQVLLSETEQRVREKLVLHYIAKNPKRYAKFKAYLSSHEREIMSGSMHPKSPFHMSKDIDFMQEGRRFKEEKAKAENHTWPENIIYSQRDPLILLSWRVFFPKAHRTIWESFQRHAQEEGFEKLTNIPIQITDRIGLDVIAKGPLTIEQKQGIVREVYQVLLSGRSDRPSPRAAKSYVGALDIVGTDTSITGPFDKASSIWFNLSPRLQEEEIGRLSSILEYHRPIFTLEQVKIIEDQIKHLRKELQKGFTRAIGRRGYTLLVSDPFLRQLGYKEITVNRESASNRINVKMTIDGEEFGFALDGNYRVILGQDLKQVKKDQDKAWLEVLVLSHLKRLICTGNEEEELKSELVGGQRQYERYRKQVGRTEHLRRLKPGWNYSTDAFNKCLNGSLPVKNLHLINRMKAEIGRGGTKETGIWTYVSGTEYVDLPDAKPIKLAFTKASEDIRKVIPLGQVSQEELKRLEEDLLEEMGY